MHWKIVHVNMETNLVGFCLLILKQHFNKCSITKHVFLKKKKCLYFDCAEVCKNKTQNHGQRLQPTSKQSINRRIKKQRINMSERTKKSMRCLKKGIKSFELWRICIKHSYHRQLSNEYFMDLLLKTRLPKLARAIEKKATRVLPFVPRKLLHPQL